MSAVTGPGPGPSTPQASGEDHRPTPERGRALAAVARSPWVLVPAVVGLVVALVLALAGSGQGLRFTVPLATVAALLGVGVAVLTAVVLGVREALRRARAAGAAHGRETEKGAHLQFLARLDHELKNPLTAIHAALTSVPAVQPTAQDGPVGAGGLGTGVPGEGALAPVAVIEAQATRMGRLVGDLRKIAALESQPVEQEAVDVEALAADAVAAVHEQLAASGAATGPDGAPVPPRRTITVALPRVPWPLPPVRGDMDLLFVALYNLLSNAVKFTAEGAHIEVRGFEEEGAVVIEVADSGAGIPAEEVSLVWQELARGSNARGVPGSGLGLAMVHAIVRRHGGQVLLSSRLGHGTSVRMRLPRAHG